MVFGEFTAFFKDGTRDLAEVVDFAAWLDVSKIGKGVAVYRRESRRRRHIPHWLRAAGQALRCGQVVA